MASKLCSFRFASCTHYLLTTTKNVTTWLDVQTCIYDCFPIQVRSDLWNGKLSDIPLVQTRREYRESLDWDRSLYVVLTTIRMLNISCTCGPWSGVSCAQDNVKNERRLIEIVR